MGTGGSGALTFVFTDVEGSTRLWEAAPEAMRDDLAHHDELLADVVRVHGGAVFKSLGDGVAAVFPDPVAALTAAVAAQRALAAATFTAGVLRVRMGVHCGDAQQRDGDWFGPTINRTARLHAVAHGGQIVISDAIASAVALPDGIALRDLGEHRLRDLAPDRIHQVLATGLQERFPPLRTEHHPSRGVPAPGGRLLGRAVERRRLAELVHGQRLVTVTGPPGGGKTRLATELARDERDRWPGGVWFCSLSSLPAGAVGGVAGRLADLLGASATDGATAVESIVGALADRRALVVLDGCDPVLDDAAIVAEALYDGCPATAVVVTSRERLDLANEHLVDLPTLDDDTAIALFVARAQAVRSGFTLAEHETAVRSLIGRLDGLPLAIELAAARVRTHSPAEIDALLGERVRLLRRHKGRGQVPDGHHDLEVAIAWSHDLLDDADRRVFRHLSVFRAAFTATDAATLLPDLDPQDAADALDALVERSLVALAPPRPTDRATRYRVLRTLREYGEDRLAEHGETDAAWARWADALLRRTRAAASRLAGPDESRWVEELADSWEDLRAVHGRAVAAGDANVAVALVAPLLHHSTMRGLEVGAWAERAVALPGFWDEPEAPRVAAIAAEVRLRRGDHAGADALAAEAIERDGGDGPWLAHSTRTLLGFLGGDFVLGGERQLELFRITAPLHTAEPLAPAVAAFVEATVFGYAGLEAMAAGSLQQLDDLAAATGCPSIRAMASLAAGRVRMAGDQASARAELQSALELATSVENVLIAAQSRWALTELSAADDPAGALQELRRLLDELRRAGDDAQEQQALLRSVGPLISLGDDETALLVTVALQRTVWRVSPIFRVARARLHGRTDGAAREVTVARAADLDWDGIADVVMAAVDRLARELPARTGHA